MVKVHALEDHFFGQFVVHTICRKLKKMGQKFELSHAWLWSFVIFHTEQGATWIAYMLDTREVPLEQRQVLILSVGLKNSYFLLNYMLAFQVL